MGREGWKETTDQSVSWKVVDVGIFGCPFSLPVLWCSHFRWDLFEKTSEKGPTCIMSTMGLLRVASWFFNWLYQHNREKVCTLTQWCDTAIRVGETEIQLGSGDLVMRGEGVRHPPTSCYYGDRLFSRNCYLNVCVCVGQCAVIWK